MNYKIARMFQILTIIITFMVVLLSAKSALEKPEIDDMESIENVEEDARDIFADSAVIDLGSHTVAYFTVSDKLARAYGYEKWIVIQKLNQGSRSGNDQILYIPVEDTITAIEADDFGLLITEKFGQGVVDIQIPICFMMETGFVELLSLNEKAILTAQSEVFSLPETVWEEAIGADEERYEIFFEKISISYTAVASAKGGKYADYRLTVKDEEGRTVQELILKNLFILYEEIYWMIDVNGDGFRDLVFCAEHEQGQENSSTKLVFLIWNNDLKKYEEKPFPLKYVERPEWSAQERELMIVTEEWGNYWARGREMYRFIDGEWQLYARLIPSSDKETPVFQDGYEKEKYYKDLDYYYIEKRYESGEMIGENVMEEAPYRNEQSMWYSEREGNQELFPKGRYSWGTDEIEP